MTASTTRTSPTASNEAVSSVPTTTGRFGGRRFELGLFRDAIDQLSSDMIGQQGLFLVTGVPGIGKTELANHIPRECGAASLAGGVSMLDDPDSLFAGIGRSIGRGSQFAEFPKGDLTYRLRRTKSLGLWGESRLLVAIDDLHLLNSRQAQQLRHLHHGFHQCPVLVAGFGGQHTPDILAAHGITVTRGFRLGRLSDRECRAAMRDGLSEMKRDAPPRVIKRLSELSLGFPPHMNSYLTASRDLIADAAGWSTRRALDFVVGRGSASCADRDRKTLSAMGEHRDRLFPLIKHLRRLDDDRVAIPTAVDQLDAGRGDGKSIFNLAVSNGVLTLEGSELHRREVGFGILHDHMIGQLVRRDRQRDDERRPGVRR